MLFADDLWRLLSSRQSRWVAASHPERRQLALSVCQQLGERLDESGIVTADTVQQITAQLYTSAQQASSRRLSRRRFVQRVETLLSEMNALPGLTILLPNHPHPLHRPTLSPTSPDEMRRLEALMVVDKQLTPWRRASRHPDRWLLELAIRLACRVGMGPEVLIGSLALLSQPRVGSAKEQHILRLPVQPIEPLMPETPTSSTPFTEAESMTSAELHDGGSAPKETACIEGCYPLILPKACRDALAHLRHRARGNQRDWLLLPSPGQQIPLLKTRQKHLRERLDRATREMLKDLRKQYPEAREVLQRLTSWSSIARNGPLLAQRAGVPSVWLQILASYPLPTCTPEPLLRGIDNERFSPGHLDARRERAANAIGVQEVATRDQYVAAPGGHESMEVSLSSEKAVALYQTMQRFLTQISTLSSTGRLTSQASRSQLLSCLRQYLDHLTHLTENKTSFYHLLLHFAFSRLREHENAVSTVTTYLSRLTPLPIQFFPSVTEMRGWDQDNFDEFCQEALSYPAWRPRTQQHFLVTLRLFTQFCQQQGLLLDVSLPALTLEDRVSTLRTAVPNPVLVKDAWRALVGHAHPSQTRQQFALALALGFYGGLRTSELCQLTLADIRVERSESGWGAWSALHALYGRGPLEERTATKVPTMYCWVYIRTGKTAAARRRLPLHILAPPEVVTLMAQWCQTRRQVAPSLALREIGLFGPLFSPMAYTRQGLVDPLLAWLRARWGSAIDYHGLRHAAISWLQLRIHAAQYPTFRNALQHHFDWMFSPQALDALHRYVCAAEGEHSVQRGTLMGQLAKLAGHRHVGTLITVYSHTLHVIHADVLQRTWSNRG